MPQKKYLLTKTAEADFQAAKVWLRKRWGKAGTKQYFEDLHHTANQIACSHLALPNSSELTNSELLVLPVRGHYIVYLPVPNQTIIIVALICQSRDVPAILATNRFHIERELKQLKISMSTQ